MEVFFTFVSLTLLNAALGIDNGLVIEFKLRSLGLAERTHLIVRSITLVIAALMRVVFLFGLSRLVFLQEPMAASAWLPNRWFSDHPETLTWMSLVLFAGGLIVIGIAVWEYYHKYREALDGEHDGPKNPQGSGFATLAMTAAYLMMINILFSLDSVFSAVAMMDLDTQFWWMVAAILAASVIMIFGMIPLSALIRRNRHVGVLMLTILSLIGAKLLVDGTGGHFSNLLLMFIIAVLLLNDVAQGLIDRAHKRRAMPQHALEVDS